MSCRISHILGHGCLYPYNVVYYSSILYISRELTIRSRGLIRLKFHCSVVRILHRWCCVLSTVIDKEENNYWLSYFHDYKTWISGLRWCHPDPSIIKVPINLSLKVLAAIDDCWLDRGCKTVNFLLLPLHLLVVIFLERKTFRIFLNIGRY